MAKKGLGVYLVFTDIDPRYEEEFNAWYNTEHLPELLALPGFLDAARYVASKGGPKYLALYELESPAALQTPEFQRWRANPSPWSRRISPTAIGQNVARVLGEQIFPATVEHPDRGMAPALQIGRMSVPEAAEAEWNTWYNTEYIPGYRQVPGVLYARRYRVVQGETRYLTLYEFEHERVSESEAWHHQRQTSSPRSGRMRDLMTHAPGSPGVYRRIFPA
ncbi:MAG: hypothetical protein KatS3mg131_2373 [Candidatus Tectimicrobiota bacterium]|nr:MAG: hypothetical protein KatS3mg131_2373 [Candidatus Tectomicrobia bacterium]